MIYRVYRFKANDELEHLGDDSVQGWETPPLQGSQWPDRGEVVWVGGDRVEWTSNDTIVYVRDMVVS